jgi:hypothetical protein
MARTKAHNRTAEHQAAWEAQEAADAREAAARRARRGCRASSDPPASDEEFILPVPSTGLEAPGNHLTGRRRKKTLVLVVLLADSSHRSASQDTLTNCAKCRGILARARLEPSLAWRQMRLLVGVTVRNSRSSAPFSSTVWPTAQGYFY